MKHGQMRRERYERYLRSETWAKIRSQILERDNHLCRAEGCSEVAVHVHHSRYPKVLGRERLEWLYALRPRCHETIHALVRSEGMSLMDATETVVRRVRSDPRPRRRKQRRSSPLHLRDDRRKREGLIAENERLHSLQKHAKDA